MQLFTTLSATKKKLLSNIFSLSALQVVNYILPLVVLPYATRVLGVELFGLTAFAFTITQYFILFTDYGFNISATKSIASCRDDSQEIMNVFMSVLFLKMMLLLICAGILLLLILLVPSIAQEKILFFTSFISVIGSVLFPQWYFLGIEKMRFITIINVFAKVVTTLSIFFLVTEKSDYIVYVFLTSAGFIIAGSIGFIYAFQSIGIKFLGFSKAIIKREFNTGSKIFMSTASINLYTTANGLLVGFFYGNEIFGYFFAAERVYRAVLYMSLPIYQAIFPHLSNIIVQNYDHAVKMYRNILRYVIYINILVTLLLFLTAPILVSILFGSEFEPSVLILRIFSFVVFSSNLSYFFGVQGAVNFGYENILLKYTVLLGILHLALVIPILHFFGVVFVPVVWFSTETLLFFFLYLALKQKGIIKNLFRN